MNQSNEIKNVYVIGCTGAGKSTLLNYLFNPDPNRQEIFKTGGGCNPVTKHIKSEIYTYKNVPIRFHDTPGLGEADNLIELDNILNIYKNIKASQTVTCIIICIRNYRVGYEIFNKINYYMKLFKDLFKIHNVIILKTHFDESNVQELIVDGGWINYVKSFRSISLGEISFKGIKFIDTINSISHLSNEELLNNPFSDGYEMNTSIYSYFIRSKIFDYIINCQSLDFSEQLFSLPHHFEQQRILTTGLYPSMQLLMIDLVRVLDEENGEMFSKLLQDIKDVSLQQNLLENKIARAKIKLEIWNRPVRHSYKIVNDIHLKNKDNFKVNLISKHQIFNLPINKLNSNLFNLRIVNSKITGNKVNLKLKHIDKNLIKYNTKPAEFFLEIDGIIINAEKISKKIIRLDKYQKRLTKINNKLEKLMKESHKYKEQIAIDVLNKSKEICILQNKYFKIDDIPKVLNLLTRL